MLPLHKSFRNSVSVFLPILIFTTCADKSKTDREIIQALNESIVSSNQMMATSSNDMMLAFEERLRDPASGERSRLWYPKAVKIQLLSNEILRYIESFKADINSKPNFSSEVFEKLMNYKRDILLIDPKITDEFQKSIKVFTRTIDSATANQKDLFQDYFDNVSTLSALAMLNKVQNNVRVIEEKAIAFCYEQSSRLSFGPCIIDFPVALINSTIVQPGEKIEVTAGVGSFYTNKNTEVFIYGQPTAVKNEGVAIYRFKAELVTGKYYIPVKIHYTDQNGYQQTVQKEIEYTVANIQQQ